MGPKKAKTAPKPAASKKGAAKKDSSKKAALKKASSKSDSLKKSASNTVLTTEPPTHSSKTLWDVMGVIAAINVIYMVAMLVMILVYKSQTKEDPSGELRSKMVTAINYAPIATMHISRLPNEVDKVPKHISTVDVQFLQLRETYQEVVDKKYYRTKSLNGWQLHGKNLYYIAKGRKTWHSAEDFCKSRGSHLASVLSDDEQNYITSQLNHSAWIGLTDEQEEGTWKWTDKSILTTQYWSEGEPSHSEHSRGTEQDCAAIVPSTTGKNWNDVDCYKQNGWVCKDSLVFSAR